MRYVYTLPKPSTTFRDHLLQTGWKKIKEPTNIFVTTLISIPILLILFVVEILYLNLLESALTKSLITFFTNNNTFSISFTINIASLSILIFCWMFMVLHELLHMAFIPNVLTSDKTKWGINMLFAFVVSEEQFSKNRFFLISIFPLIVLSILFPLLLDLFGLLNQYTMTLALINAAGSCVDVLGICIVGMRVPKNGIIVSNVTETYYKI